MRVAFNCSCCGKFVEMEVDQTAYGKWQNGTSIQEAFPDKDPFFREALIQNYCYDCIERVFHTPKPGNEEAWGKQLGECECCGCSIWERDVKDGKFHCPTCGEEQIM